MRLVLAVQDEMQRRSSVSTTKMMSSPLEGKGTKSIGILSSSMLCRHASSKRHTAPGVPARIVSAQQPTRHARNVVLFETAA
jgi:hypothetical protein